jgi:hypothetical protein
MVGVQRNINDPSHKKDLWMLKTNLDGDVMREHVIGDPDLGEEAFAVAHAQDLNFVVAGEKGIGSAGTVWSDLWLLKVSGTYGDTLWTRSYGYAPGYPDRAYDIQPTTGGGYIVAGYTKGVGVGDLWLLKTDDEGDTVWTRTYGGRFDDVGYAVRQTDDGGYIVVGNTKSYGAFNDLWIVKVDSLGRAPVAPRNVTPGLHAATFGVVPRGRSVAFRLGTLPRGAVPAVTIHTAAGDVCRRLAPGAEGVMRWDAYGAPAGMYIAVLSTSRGRCARAFVLN